MGRAVLTATPPTTYKNSLAILATTVYTWLTSYTTMLLLVTRVAPSPSKSDRRVYVVVSCTNRASGYGNGLGSPSVCLFIIRGSFGSYHL